MNEPVPDQPADLSCVEFVDMITGYLDEALPADVTARAEWHLSGCSGCTNALNQFRTVIAQTGRLTEADVDGIDPLTRDRLHGILRRLRLR